MGMMIRNPIARLSAVSIQNVLGDCPPTSIRISTTMAAAMAAFRGCCILKVIGLPLISPCSLENAMIEPENVMAPMTRPNDISMRLAE